MAAGPHPGPAALRAGDYALAQDYQSQAVQANPSLSVAWAERARSRYYSGDYQGSIADSLEATRLSPDDPWNYIERARAYLDSGLRAQAAQDFGEAIRLDPGYYLPYVMRAGILEEDGQDARALADYQAAARLFPEYYYSYESIGVLGMKLERWAEAAAAFQDAFRRSPQECEYAILAANAWLRAGQPRKARELAESALPGIDREKFDAQYLMLRLFMENGDSSQAELSVMAMKKLDDRALMVFFLAEYWKLRGKADLALKYHQYVRDMGRKGSFADRLNEIEAERGALNG